MRKYQSSLTAQGIAIVRAIESEKPAGERICYDPLARQLVNPALAAMLRFFTRFGYADKRGPGVWEFLTARDRYIDDYLQACLDDGVAQVVILGAGFDSRAYRFEALRRLKVYEVDHPATQKDKIARLTKILGKLPEHVVYVPVDFETETLAERLQACGYDSTLRTVFLWQGVTHYLTPEAVDSTLAFISGHSGRGSSVVFDYVYTAVVDGTIKRGEADAMRRNSRLSGEAIRFGIPEGQVAAFLRARGFDDVKDVTAADLHRLYFTGVNENKSVAPVYAIVSATVCLPRAASPREV